MQQILQRRRLQGRILYCTLGIWLALPATANDPFDKKQRHQSKIETQSTAQTPLESPCKSVQAAFFPHTPFAQLRVVGTIQRQNAWQLILQADNQISFVKVGDVIASETIKIDSISKQNITFLRRNHHLHCEHSVPFDVQF